MVFTGKVSEVVSFSVSRLESGFDRAVEAAYGHAVSKWGIDEDCHQTRDILFEKFGDFTRSTDSIVVVFKDLRCSGGVGGVSYVYGFESWIERCDGEVEDLFSPLESGPGEKL